jgi:hypothetical protein
MHKPIQHGTASRHHSTAAGTHVDKSRIVEILRSRGLHDRADWVDRELPGVVDTHENSSLLRMLQIDAAAIE